MSIERPTNLGAINPAAVDVEAAPKPKRRRRKVPAMPKLLEPWAAEAKKRTAKRPVSPGVMLEADEHGDFVPVAPHANDDVWRLQIHNAFATRSPSTVRVFIEQLRALCGQHYDHDAGDWRPSEIELNAALNFINSVQPRNEAEAGLAAQMLAVHLMTMKLAAQALTNSDARTAAVAGKLARTYAMQLDVLNRGRGKGRSTRQHITVKHEKHVHAHQHQHHCVGLCPDAASPPLPTGAPNVRQIEQPARLLQRSAAVSGEDTLGATVPLASRERKARV